MSTIADRLKEERKRLGFNQEGFAELAGITKRPYIEWEGGRTSPTAAQLAALAIEGADVQYIVTGERDGSPPLKHDEQTLLDGYRALDATTKRRVLAFVLGGEPAPQSAGQKIAGRNHQITQSGQIVNVGSKGKKT